jgi:hypothetical protein
MSRICLGRQCAGTKKLPRLQVAGVPRWAWVELNYRPHAYQDTAADDKPLSVTISLRRRWVPSLATFALLINVVAYTMYFRRRRRSGL